MNKLSFQKKLFFSLLAALVSLLVLAGVTEIYLRWFYPGEIMHPGNIKQRPLQYEAAIFARHVFPQIEQRVIREGREKYYINAQGYRGHDFRVAKPADVVRIIFYGGSFVFDLNQDGEADWPHQVEARLNERGLGKVEVINAGIPGHASFDSFGRLFAEGHTFEPDYVVLCNAWNDIKYFTRDQPLLRIYKPFSIEMDPRFYYQGPLDRFLCRHSYLYLIERELYYVKQYRIGPEGAAPEPPHDTGAIQDLALKQYRLDLEMFVELARSIGAVPVLMTQPRLVSPANSAEDRKWIKYEYVSLTHEQLCRAFALTDQIIKETAQSKHVLLIEAAAPLTGRRELFQDHIHFNARGSQEMAELVALEFGQILAKRNSAVKENESDGVKP